jgi:hypothetical protein
MEIATSLHTRSNHAVCVTESPSHIWEKHHRAHRTGGAGLMALPKHLSRPRATQYAYYCYLHLCYTLIYNMSLKDQLSTLRHIGGRPRPHNLGLTIDASGAG